MADPDPAHVPALGPLPEHPEPPSVTLARAAAAMEQAAGYWAADDPRAPIGRAYVEVAAQLRVWAAAPWRIPPPQRPPLTELQAEESARLTQLIRKREDAHVALRRARATLAAIADGRASGGLAVSAARDALVETAREGL